MSIKDLFGKSSEKIVSAKQLKDFYSESESEGYLEEVIKDKDRFLPAVDFSTASNFARYGSAEKYYVDGISNIYQNYPYDGSRKEKQEWRNASSQLDLYIFDNIYPKTVGYVNLDSGSLLSTIRNSVSYRSASVPQYVLVRGGPNPSPNGKFEKANIYDLSKNRESNLGISELGNTVEFWFKDNASTGSVNYNNVFCLFDSWNGVSSGSDSYARLTIQHSASNSFLLTYASGTSGIVEHPLSFAVDRNSWNHYAFTFKNAENNIDLELCLYVNGDLAVKETVLNAGGISLANNYGMYASIGAFMADQDAISSNSWRGLGTSFGSFDEFRFWKSVRSSKQIYRNCFVQVGGGSNTDDSNTDLGVYYKFNEGIINSSSNNDLDAVCVDYSGRASNALIINYNINVRNTSSAIDIHLNGDLPITDPDYVYYEEKDPILFSSNPLVIQISDYYQKVGSEHDRNNNANIYYSIPSWIVEDAENRESNDLSNLVQIISSYFDSLHLQIKDLPTLKNADYVKDGIKPKPFTNKLLSSYGFENVEIFNDVTFLEDVLSRGEQINFEEKLHNIKNTIYQNIYNNLAYIYKSKGTEKSLRNLIRCFGVDDELIKINLYADESRYEFTDKFKSTTTVKKFVDFNDADRYNGFIYQKNINGDTDTKGYISGNLDGNLDYVPITSQVEVIFPKKVLYDDPQYEIPDWTEVSLFGAHTAKQDENNLIWGNELNNDLFNFQVYAVKRNYESPDVYFKLVTTMSGTTTVLTTSYYNEVYDNQKWNFAVRLSPTKLDFANTVTQSNISDYVLEFIGHNSILDNVENSFKLSLQIPEANGKAALRSNKRFYVGAHYTNFNSSYLLAKTDIKASSLRVWMDYLSDDELKLHSYDSSNFGRQYPNWKPHYETTEDSSLTKLDTLALNWDFFNVTSSDNSGQFLVQDTSTGSLSKSLNYSSVGKVALLRHTGFADNFYPNDDQVVNKEYIFSAKQVNPESIAGSDLIQTPLTDDVTRTKTSKPINFYISIEKSMYQIINDEILNWFSTIKDFNNLVGDPIEKYRAEYKSLNHLKRMFFDKVGTAPDFEKFLSFYKWIDNSISSMLTQFIPASANTTNKVRNIIESHLLERNKYQNIPPNLNFNGDIKSIFGSTLNYSYEDQKAPASPPGQLWLKQRVERTDVYANTPLEPQNDIDREIIRQVINSKNLTSVPVFYNAANNEQYDGKKDAVRFFGQTYRLDVKTLTIAEKIINPVEIANQQFTGQFKFAQQSVTGSGQIVQPLKKKPNFLNKYEYLQLSGRATNNKSFIDVTGAISSVTSSVSGVVDRTLPNRNTYKNIFVERFSAPGGPETLSRGALDNTSEEYSAYNDLNSRNIRVRKQLRSWLAESASYDRVNPSIHKVNKNTGYRPLDNSGVTIKPVYDNAYVSHLIPQSDAQYSWITGALAAKPKTSGYMTDYENLNSYNSSSFQLLSGSVSGTSIIDYLGLNLTIDRSVDLINGITNTGSNYDGDLNKYLNNNNGPFGYPSWKQIRKDTNKIVQDSVKNNKILSQDIPIQRSKTEKGYTLFYTNNKEQAFTAYKQPAVTFNKPMKHSLFVTGSEEAIHVVSTYDNNKERFTNSDLAKATKTYEKNDPQAHDLFAALDDGLYDPKPELYKIDYETLLYPSDTYAGLSDVRLRDNYEDLVGNTGSIVNARTFWRDNIEERARASVTEDIYEFGDTQNSILSTNLTASFYNTSYYFGFTQNDAFKESIFSLDNFLSYSITTNNNISSDTGTNLISFNPFNNSLDKSFGNYVFKGGPAVTNILSSSEGIYVLGEFITSSETGPSDYISRWDGYKWNNVGSINNPTYSILSASDGVYVGGNFYNADGNLAADFFAKWNGSTWTNVGTGSVAGSNAINSFVKTIISASDGIYIGGAFTNAGGIASADYVAKWNGIIWTNVGTGSVAGSNAINGNINTLLSASDGIYAGGTFIDAGGNTSADRIAKWNGVIWTNVGVGLNGTVNTLLSASDGIYAGGTFTDAGGNTSADYIAKWNGSTWTNVGTSSTGGAAFASYLGSPPTIFSLVSSSDGIYAGGYFYNAGGVSGANFIAKWNGTNWQNANVSLKSLGSNYSYVNVLKNINNQIYAGGVFSLVSASNTNLNILKYTKNIQGYLYNKNLIKEKYFINSNISYNLSNNAIYNYKYDNIYNIYKNYAVDDTNINNTIVCSFSSSDGIYIGGGFTNAGGVSSADYFAKWNGSTWTNVGTGSSSGSAALIGTGVYAAISASEGIYIAGDVVNIGGVSSADYFARWNGTNWTNVGTGSVAGSNAFDQRVTCILSASDGIYVGGSFNNVGGISAASSIARWNGSTWTNVGTGSTLGSPPFVGAVTCLLTASDGIYAGGSFINAAGIAEADYIARWNGSTWTNVGSPLVGVGVFNNVVNVLLSGSDGIYAGGNFTNAYSITSADYIARWNGSTWTNVGTGSASGSPALNGQVFSLFSNSSGLYVGGEFTGDNGGKSLNNIARWDGKNWNYLGRSNNRNGFNINASDRVLTITELNSEELFIGGSFNKTKSGPLIKSNKYDYYIEGFYNKDGIYMPSPQLLFNNFIPPSSGSTIGMTIKEITYNNENNISFSTEYNKNEKIFFLNEGASYEIEEKSGKKPFFNSYLEYLGNLKAQTQKYSIIPEYTISDFIKIYVKEKNGNYNSILDQDYLKLNGSSQEAGYEDINNSINITNKIKPDLIFDNSKNNDNISLNFKISGIKKLIPYRDFYPSERVIKLSNYFINSFLDLNIRLTSVLNPDEIYSSSLSNGTPINHQILTLLQPVMAPGILLNTIKSSVAVDWPLFITNSVSYDSTTSPIFYAHTGSELITNKSSDPIYETDFAYTASNFINKEQNYRLPFEAIIEFDTRIPQELRSDDKNMYYLNPTYYTSDIITGSEYRNISYPSYNMGTGSLKPFVFRDSNYKLAMHNFLAEIPNFFLNGKLTNIVSLPENEFGTAKRGVTYYMDVVLERDSKYKEFIADPYYEGLKAQANSFYDGTFLLPSPDSLYGPPTRYWNNVNPNPFFARSPYNFFSKLLDTPAYAPYVPPYYYGKAVARISFTADDSRQYSLSEIQNSCSVQYINTEAEALFRQRSNFINGNFTGSFTDNYSTSPAYKQMMRLSSSVNLFLASDTKLTKFDPKTGQTIEVGDRETNNKSWIIQTKFETPSINFIDSDLSGNLGLQFLGGTKESGSVKGIYSYMMKGLWTTYGQPVDNGSGIKLYVQDSFQKTESNQTGSLIDLCGFRNAGDKKTIGLLAERKKVSECMVMIPYTFNKNHGPNMNRDYAATIDPILGENGIYLSSQTGNGPYYYAIDMGVMVDYLGGLSFERASVEQIKAAAEASPYRNSTIIKLILAMIKYVVPPHLDWIRNKDIRPFVMYVAEFSTEFDKQDLSDIWQGVMPKQSYKAEIEQIDINHKFTVNEFFHGKRPQNDTKFKVFKVKQRANINYYKLTDDSKDDDRFKFTFGNSQQATIPEYSYNWPYDFFSLVELVNIDANLSVDNFPQTTEAQRRKTLSEAVQTLGPVRPEIAKEILGDKIKQDRKGDRLEVENTRLKPGSDSSREQPETPLAPKFKKIKKPRGD